MRRASMVLFLGDGMSVPGRYLPSVGSADKGGSPSNNHSFAWSGLRRRPFIGYNRALGAKRHDLNILIIGDVSRRKLGPFDPLAVGVQAAPFPVCDADNQ